MNPVLPNYTYTDNQYPETVPAIWHEQDLVQWDNDFDRIWNKQNLRSKRTGRPLPKLSVWRAAEQKGRLESELNKLLDPQFPRSREYFHNYDVIDSRWSWGRCLCEIRFISGEKCEAFVNSDKDGRAQIWATDVAESSNTDTQDTGITNAAGKTFNHWAWYIDIAPRGQVCPIAKQRFMVAQGNPAVTDIPCRISIPNAAPYETWVLAQSPDAAPYSRPPRIDWFLRVEENNEEAGFCPRCRVRCNENLGTLPFAECVSSENQWFRPLELERHKFETRQDGPIQPYIYSPEYKPNKTIPAHPSLVPGYYYHKEDFDLLETQLDILVPPTDRVIELAWDLDNMPIREISEANLQERNRKIQQRIDDEAEAASKAALEIAAYEEAAKNAAALAASKDHGQWH